MNSDVLVTVSLRLRPEKADDFCDEMLPALQTQTRAFKGVKSARAVRQSEDRTRLMFIDVFETEKDVDAYFSWRKSTGDLDLLHSLLTEPPVIEMWPIAAGTPG